MKEENRRDLSKFTQIEQDHSAAIGRQISATGRLSCLNLPWRRKGNPLNLVIPVNGWLYPCISCLSQRKNYFSGKLSCNSLIIQALTQGNRTWIGHFFLSGSLHKSTRWKTQADKPIHIFAVEIKLSIRFFVWRTLLTHSIAPHVWQTFYSAVELQGFSLDRTEMQAAYSTIRFGGKSVVLLKE